MRLLLSFVLIVAALVSALLLHEELTDAGMQTVKAAKEEDRSQDLLELELGDAPILVMEQRVENRQDPRVAPPPEPEPEPEPAPAPQRFVFLEPNGTLSEVAEKHLGKSARWREILELNGWSEKDVLRLQAGTKILLPPK